MKPDTDHTGRDSTGWYHLQSTLVAPGRVQGCYVNTLELWASGSLHCATVKNCGEKRLGKLLRFLQALQSQRNGHFCWCPTSCKIAICSLLEFADHFHTWHQLDLDWSHLKFILRKTHMTGSCWNYFILYFSYSAVVPEAQDTALGLNRQPMFACMLRTMNPKQGASPPFSGPGVTSAHSPWLTTHPACSPHFPSLQALSCSSQFSA